MVIVIKNTGSGVVAESVIINSFHFSMKRNFYALAAAVLLGSAVSASAFEYTATPASGSTVDMLSKIGIKTLDTGFDGVALAESMDGSGITVTDASTGASVSTVQLKDDSNFDYNTIWIELDTPISTNGEYMVHIPAGTILTFEEEVWNDADINLTYTVVASTGVTYDVVPESVYPADGSTMNIKEGINNITLTFAGEYGMVAGAKGRIVINLCLSI